jgi:2-oxoglutarate ferredoxin oxidoreductase subunit beta
MKVEEYIRDRQSRGEIVTGLLYVDESAKELHEMNATPTRGLSKLPYSSLCPGAAQLAAMQEDFR